jgi:pimeloyl-ACP methyl ester carboxylesterase
MRMSLAAAARGRGGVTATVVTVAAAVAAALVAGCSGGSAPLRASLGSGASPGRGGLSGGTGQGASGLVRAVHWHSCPRKVDGQAHTGTLRCGQLQVPLNYASPGGRKISIALSEVPATAPPSQRQGALLVNPGGPGASGLALPTLVAAVLGQAVSADYDIIGFDTRGVGSSVPALHCDASFFTRPRPSYVPSSSAAERVLINRAKAYAADCERRFGWLLPHMTTADIARDMDSIRAALGQQKISYLGYSYGTYLGQVYGTLFPGRVRRMVLDSVVDPAGVWYADNISQDYAFQGRMNAFFAWVAANDAAYHLGGTRAAVAAAWARAVAQVRLHPITGPSGPLIGPDELSDTFLVGGYEEAIWPGLAAALTGYSHGGSAGQLISLYRSYGQQSENEFAVYNAVNCADVNWPRSWAKWNADTWRVYRTAPFEAWGNAWFNAACAFWPVKGPATPMRIDGAQLPPVLMLQGTLDAATPYAGALVARKALPSARMVVVKGGGNHGQSLTSPPDPCVLAYLSRYLGNGTLPANSGLVSATCPAMPAPAA